MTIFDFIIYAIALFEFWQVVVMVCLVIAYRWVKSKNPPSDGGSGNGWNFTIKFNKN